MAGAAEWFVAGNGKPVGPMSLDDLVARLGATGDQARIYGPGLADWTPARQVPAGAPRLRTAPAGGGAPIARSAPPPPLSYASPGGAGRAPADVIDYEVFGNEMQY